MRSEFDRYHVPMALLGAVASATALACLARALAHVAACPSFAASPIRSIAVSVSLAARARLRNYAPSPAPSVLPSPHAWGLQWRETRERGEGLGMRGDREAEPDKTISRDASRETRKTPCG
jgi:hypothetical protein